MKTAVTTGQVRHCWPDFVSISSQLPSLSASRVYSSRASFTECQGCIWKGNKRGITLRSAPWRKAIWCGETESRQFRSFWLPWMAADVLTRAAHRANRLQSMQTSYELHVSRFFPRTLFKTCFTWNFSPQQSAACQEPRAPAVKKNKQQKAAWFRKARRLVLTETPLHLFSQPPRAYCPSLLSSALPSVQQSEQLINVNYFSVLLSAAEPQHSQGAHRPARAVPPSHWRHHRQDHRGRHEPHDGRASLWGF